MKFLYKARNKEGEIKNGAVVAADQIQIGRAHV